MSGDGAAGQAPVTGAALAPSEAGEWLETDGLGGFASGTTLGLNTRRYHGLLVTALVPPAGRHVLVNDAAVWLESGGVRRSLSSHRYGPASTRLGDAPLQRFSSEPWPCFERELDGMTIWQEVVMLHGLPLVLVSWRFSRPLPGQHLTVRPLLSGRNFHASHHENPAFRFEVEARGEQRVFHPYASLPAVISLADGDFTTDPRWFRRTSYAVERERGFDHEEDLASPGLLRFELAEARAEWILAADTAETRALCAGRSARSVASEVRERETARRATFATPLARAADAYLVRRGSGKTIIAGYPWFGDWGRDTFIAIRGLCFATGRWAEAREILLAWAGSVSEGLLPNRFPDDPGEPAEYNSVDAALWYVIALAELIRDDPGLGASERAALLAAADQIIAGHVRGTRHGIRVDADGLLAAGAPGLQLTWMDAKVGERVITPRVGKPVEVQALWLNALGLLQAIGHGQPELLARGRASFAERFDPGDGGLFDVVDVDHRPGAVDASVRPNQVLAVGGLPLALLPPERCRRVLEVVQAQLWTSIGLRSLAPSDPAYAPRYTGGPAERDAKYHQGTVWPWLLGPFIQAWVACRGDAPGVRAEARRRFLQPWREQLAVAGVGHISEIADGDAPHTPRGCPFQAWSVSELVRIERLLGEAR